MSKKTGYCGNQNAAKSAEDRRIPLTIRLPPDLLNQLRSQGNVTAQIEAAIREYLNSKNA